MSRTATGGAGRVARGRRGARPKWIGRVKRLIAYFVLLLLIATIVLSVIFGQALRQAQAAMTTLRERMDAVHKSPSLVYSADRKLLYTVTNEYRKRVELGDVPKHVVNAILAAEDKRFYTHTGVDLTALMRVGYTALRDKRARSGGSTLTMQLAKRLYSGSERTLQRKMQDIALAWTMERELSKEEILDLYLNQVYFGERAYGIGAAAEVYFAKTVEDLTIPEAAMLARCVRRPSHETPFLDLKKATANRNVVLAIMRDEQMITETEYKKAKKDKPKLNRNRRTTTAMIAPGAEYFVNHVLETFRQEYPGVDLNDGGYTIHTTLDLGLQRIAQKEVARVVRRHRRQGVTTGAFVVVDKDGRILAEVGGVDFHRNQFNVIWQGRGRQPGSSFKPFIYAAGLHSGAFNGHSVDNGRVYIEQPGQKPYSPEGGGPHGYVSIRSALAQSYNRAAVHAIQRVGYQTAVNYGRDVFGFRSKLQPVPSLALGVSEVTPLEMAEAYSTFMLRGDRVRPYPMTRVEQPDGKVRRFEPTRFSSVFDPQVSQEIDDYLRAVVTSGTGRTAGIVPNARGKTGTTQEGKDAWFCGYADGLIGIGWVANEQLRKGKRPLYGPMPTVYGGKVTVQIWAGVMKEAWRKHKAPIDFSQINGGEVLGAWKVDEPRERERRRRERERDRDRPYERDTPTDDVIPEPVEDVPLVPQPEDPDDVEPAPARDPQPRERPREETRQPEPERPRRRQEEPRQNNDYAEVEVCADSGQRASLYCPETVPRRYTRGGAPRRRCRLHSGGG